jgi:epoxyqueuosine reductase
VQTSDGESSRDWQLLRRQITAWSEQLGFHSLGITDTDLARAEIQLGAWLDAGWHGEMDYMARHGSKRSRPEELLPGTVRVISVAMDYWPAEAAPANETLADGSLGYVSRYALGRDYHKLMRKLLQTLALRIASEVGGFGYRVFVDSAPVLEKPLAEKSGVGWIGKHTNLISRERGSWFFLGEIYTDLPLPIDPPATAHCGSCSACLPACPTQAIVAPGKLDARRCISYLTIELKGPIPEEFRTAMGNRIYGCDDCQLVCPWNKFARAATHPDFKTRHGLDASSLTELFAWSEAEFNAKMAGSAISRLGYERWLRNIAVALGNAPPSPAVLAALSARADDASPLIREHVGWALGRQSAH